MGSTRMEGRANGGYDVKLRHKRMARAAYRVIGNNLHKSKSPCCVFWPVWYWHRQFRSVR